MATSIRLTAETEQRLDFLAAQTGRTKPFYLREVIERGIEGYYLADDVLERVRKGKEKVYSAERVRKSLGLEDLSIPNGLCRARVCGSGERPRGITRCSGTLK